MHIENFSPNFRVYDGYVDYISGSRYACCAWNTYMGLKPGYGNRLWYACLGRLHWSECVCLLAVWIVCYMHRFEYLGIWKIKENGIFVTSFLGSRFNLSFEDIRYIGIEHCILSGTKQFWIYLSAHPIEKKYSGYRFNSANTP